MVVMVRAPQTVIMTITAEINIAETDIARPLRIDAEVKEMTTTEITLVTENGAIMITTIEAVQEVAAEAETEDERVDEIAGTGLAGIDLGIATNGVGTGIDLETDTEIDLYLDLDPDLDLVTGPGTDPETEIVVDLVIDLGIEIEKDLVIGEKGTARTIDHVDAEAKAQTKGRTTAQMTGRKETAVTAPKIPRQIMDLTKEATSPEDDEAVVEAENEAKRAAEESVGLEAKVDRQAKLLPRINNSHFVFSCDSKHDRLG